MNRHIVAMGGGGFSMEPDNPLLDDFALSLTGKTVPRVCFLGTASGDSHELIDRFYANFPSSKCKPMHLTLFRRQRGDLRKRLLANDLIYVGGGSTANMLAIWRLHEIDEVLRDAWRAGTVLAGVSAGACCWFEAAITDSFGLPLHGMNDGLKLLSGSFCPHYDGESTRKPRFRQLVSDGFSAGYGVDDGAALHFIGTQLSEVVSSRPSATAIQLSLNNGKPTERDLPVRYLGAH